MTSAILRRLKTDAGLIKHIVTSIPAFVGATPRTSITIKSMIDIEWKKIPGFDNYEVSNSGYVRNSDTMKVLKGRLSSRGYVRVSLKKKNHSVHRLVALAFLGKSELHVNHKDGDKLNNSIQNLEYCSISQNATHAFALGLRTSNLKGKKTQRGVLLIGNDGLITRWDSIRDAGIAMSISESSIGQVCRGIRKTAGGFVWKYSYGSNLNE